MIYSPIESEVSSTYYGEREKSISFRYMHIIWFWVILQQYDLPGYTALFYSQVH